MMRAGSFVVTVISLSATLIACADSISPDPTIASFTITPEGTTVVGVGSERTFTASLLDQNGDPISSVPVTWSSLNPNVATIDSESGEATGVASGQVTIAATADDTTVYALLTVSVPGLAAVTNWSSQDLGFLVLNVWGTAPDNVYAVGGGRSGGRVAHYNGTDWQVSIVTDSSALWSVWGTSASDVFAVGDFGAIVHYDGTSWSSMVNPASGPLFDVWAAAPNDVIAVGGGGILHYDGTAWTFVDSTATNSWAVWGTSSTNVHFAGASEERDLWGTSATDAFSVAPNGRIMHFDGGSWSPMASGTNQPLFGVWGAAPDDVYAVGFAGEILHYDGVDWSPLNSGSNTELWKVWGISSGDVFVVSRFGPVLQGTR